MTGNLFELASRAKTRFLTADGALIVEDLWDAPLEEVHTCWRWRCKALS
jgi:hypothetical protein